MILFCGDPHGQFDHIIEAVQEHRPAAVILLGDVQAQRPLEVELASILDKTENWFIHGNHDTDTEGIKQITTNEGVRKAIAKRSF